MYYILGSILPVLILLILIGAVAFLKKKNVCRCVKVALPHSVASKVEESARV